MSSVAEIAQSKWNIVGLPFRHCVVENAFQNGTYEKLAKSFHEKLNRSGGNRLGSEYDARISSVRPNDVPDFYPLFDRGFLETVARAFRVNALFEVDGALHQHPPNSRSGWIHNDFNPGWFPRPAEQEEVLLCDHEACNYRTGKTNGANVQPVERIRALTIIYYLNNPNWQTADGGQTGIYASNLQPVDRPEAAVPPRDNTLLIFECSPVSYHTFLSSRRTRNSVILWLHRTLENGREQWPYHEPVRW
jgi:hypothetical protein